MPDALAVVISAAPTSSPRSDGLIGEASTRTTTSSGPGSGIGTLASEISSSPLVLDQRTKLQARSWCWRSCHKSPNLRFNRIRPGVFSFGRETQARSFLAMPLFFGIGLVLCERPAFALCCKRRKRQEEGEMGHSEIDDVRALLSSKPRPVGWQQRRQRIEEVGSAWPAADDIKLEPVDIGGIAGGVVDRTRQRGFARAALPAWRRLCLRLHHQPPADGGGGRAAGGGAHAGARLPVGTGTPLPRRAGGCRRRLPASAGRPASRRAASPSVATAPAAG